MLSTPEPPFRFSTSASTSSSSPASPSFAAAPSIVTVTPALRPE
jgi:hypothetical protein